MWLLKTLFLFVICHHAAGVITYAWCKFKKHGYMYLEEGGGDVVGHTHLKFRKNQVQQIDFDVYDSHVNKKLHCKKDIEKWVFRFVPTVF